MEIIEFSETAKEALRILRSVSSEFSNRARKTGSGFVGPEPNTVLTCAHVVQEQGKNPTWLTVSGKPAQIREVRRELDLAVLTTDDNEVCRMGQVADLEIGDPLMFAGYPTGVTGPSVFSGTLSAKGTGLIKNPQCYLLQLNGMINHGNSGGPVLKVGTNAVVAAVTAKYVPLLVEVQKVRDIVTGIPQFPSGTIISGIDFSKFVNLTIQAFAAISGSLLLVQVGTGYAVPLELWYDKAVMKS